MSNCFPQRRPRAKCGFSRTYCWVPALQPCTNGATVAQRCPTCSTIGQSLKHVKVPLEKQLPCCRVLQLCFHCLAWTTPLRNSLQLYLSSFYVETPCMSHPSRQWCFCTSQMSTELCLHTPVPRCTAYKEHSIWD